MAPCMKMFAKEKTIPCSPAGIPIFIILLSSGVVIPSFLMSIWYGVFFLRSSRRIIPELIMFDMTVAIATPSTVIPNPMTRRRLSPMFTIPAAMSA